VILLDDQQDVPESRYAVGRGRYIVRGPRAAG